MANDPKCEAVQLDHRITMALQRMRVQLRDRWATWIGGTRAEFIGEHGPVEGVPFDPVCADLAAHFIWAKRGRLYRDAFARYEAFVVAGDCAIWQGPRLTGYTTALALYAACCISVDCTTPILFSCVGRRATQFFVAMVEAFTRPAHKSVVGGLMVRIDSSAADTLMKAGRRVRFLCQTTYAHAVSVRGRCTCRTDDAFARHTIIAQYPQTMCWAASAICADMCTYDANSGGDYS